MKENLGLAPAPQGRGRKRVALAAGSGAGRGSLLWSSCLRVIIHSLLSSAPRVGTRGRLAGGGGGEGGRARREGERRGSTPAVGNAAQGTFAATATVDAGERESPSRAPHCPNPRVSETRLDNTNDVSCRQLVVRFLPLLRASGAKRIVHLQYGFEKTVSSILFPPVVPPPQRLTPRARPRLGQFFRASLCACRQKCQGPRLTPVPCHEARKGRMLGPAPLARSAS